MSDPVPSDFMEALQRSGTALEADLIQRVAAWAEEVGGGLETWREDPGEAELAATLSREADRNHAVLEELKAETLIAPDYEVINDSTMVPTHPPEPLDLSFLEPRKLNFFSRLWNYLNGTAIDLSGKSSRGR